MLKRLGKLIPLAIIAGIMIGSSTAPTLAVSKAPVTTAFARPAYAQGLSDAATTGAVTGFVSAGAYGAAAYASAVAGALSGAGSYIMAQWAHPMPNANVAPGPTAFDH